MELLPRSAPLFLTAREFRELIGASRASVYELIRSGQLPAVRLGKRGTLRIPRREAERFLQARLVIPDHGLGAEK